MRSAIYRVTVQCESPDGTLFPHHLDVLSDGTVVTPDHELEDWSRSLTVMEALGAEGDVSACIWWRNCDLFPSTSVGWNNGRLVVLHETGGDRVIGSYDVRDWHIETLDEWTIQARAAIEQRLGLNRVGTPNSWWSWAKGQATPEEILSYLQRIPADQLNGSPGIQYQPLVSLIATLKRDNESIEDWVATGQDWTSIEAWKHAGYNAAEANAFCTQYNESYGILERRFGVDLLRTMVFHPPVSLATSLAAAQIEKGRALGLMRCAPQIIFPDWPGMAEQHIPPLPEEVNPSWVAEAILAIPATGFLRHLNRNEFAIAQVRDIPRRISENGDPQTWDPNWCWPEDWHLVEKEPETP